MSTDFFDEDLLKSPRVIRNEKSGYSVSSQGQPLRPTLDPAKPRLVRQKEEITSHVVGATTEIERLRQRQELLEKEKRELEALARKQDEYEKNKREIIERLEKSIMMLEKEDEQAHKLLEVLSETIARFKTTLAELNEINEEMWSDQDFKAELERALVRVEIAAATYKKAMAKIEALSSSKINPDLSLTPAQHSHQLWSGGNMRFLDWLRAGLAFSLPLMIFLIFVFVVHLLLNNIFL